MDSSSSGIAGKLAAWGGVAVACIVLLGGVTSMIRQVAEVNDKLDRNCRVLVQLDQDVRLIQIEQERLHNLRVGGHLLGAFPRASC